MWTQRKSSYEYALHNTTVKILKEDRLLSHVRRTEAA